MKKILVMFLSACCFVSCFFVIGDDEERKLGVFFCTCDLDYSKTKNLPSDKSLGGRENAFIVVNKDDSNKHNHFRHCFMLLAEEVEINFDNEKKLALYMIESAGYYPRKESPTEGLIISEDSWILDVYERKKYAISCVPVIQEGMIGVNKKNPNSEISVEDVDEFWEKIRSEMKKNAKNKPYSQSHNCCTVPFDALRNIRNNSKKFSIDLSHIKKRRYNFLGHGISFDNKDDSILDYVEGSVRLISDSSIILPKVIVRIVTSFHDSTKYATPVAHDDLIPPDFIYFEPRYVEPENTEHDDNDDSGDEL